VPFLGAEPAGAWIKAVVLFVALTNCIALMIPTRWLHHGRSP
jgi:hypothetical protein